MHSSKDCISFLKSYKSLSEAFCTREPDGSFSPWALCYNQPWRMYPYNLLLRVDSSCERGFFWGEAGVMSLLMFFLINKLKTEL